METVFLPATLTSSAVLYGVLSFLRSAALGRRSVLLVAPGADSAEALVADLRALAGSRHVRRPGAVRLSRIAYYPAWETLPFDLLSPAAEIRAERVHTLSILAGERDTGESVCVVTTAESLLQRVPSPKALGSSLMELTPGQTVSREELVHYLERSGYEQGRLVEEVGQMSVRGSVIDLFPPGSAEPVRIEYLGDIVESLRSFDSSSQRSRSPLAKLLLLPVREFELPCRGEAATAISRQLRERASDLGVPRSAVAPIEDAIGQCLFIPGIDHLAPYFWPEGATVFDYLPKTTTAIVWDPAAVSRAIDARADLIHDRAERARAEGQLFPPVARAFAEPAQLREILNLEDLAHITDDSGSGALQDTFRQSVQPLNRLRADMVASRHKERPFEPVAKAIEQALQSGARVVICALSLVRMERIAELLEGYSLRATKSDEPFVEWWTSTTPTPVPTILRADLSRGFSAERDRLLVLAESDIFPGVVQRASPALSQIRRFVGAVSQIKENDYVVHADHGIAVYRGLKELSVEGRISDFLHLEYAEGDRLYVPVENIGRLQKYVAAEGKKPTLSRLGGQAWLQTKLKVREDTLRLAGQLLDTLAKRELLQGRRYAAMTAEDRAFADSFPYEETPDQAKAIGEVLSDLAKGRPMDRVVCGDVGYGKTEVALRAAFKVAHEGGQVAVLVPTTILAEQHYETFSSRFAGTAVRVACVSRFQPASENKRVLEGLSSGLVDVVIGTHRLLQKDVFFKDLSLVVIDEEHRFGVAHKERLRRLRAELHVLTLTATPIPRTLHMSLSGIRELSVIETAPANRQVVRTYLTTYNPDVVREAITRELARQGQVFFVHNRVENIAGVAEELKAIVPEARIAIGHGQMKEKELEEVMHRFITHEVDVLICTTIVESGIDVPNANTILIRNADRFGLAELYQLRGRVGRSARRAYAYLLVPPQVALGEEARKRLEVLKSLDDLGVGFRLALHDMEIRGAGHVLGRDQSGQVGLVGFELYSRILRDAVRELESRRARGGAVARKIPEVDPELSLGFPAHIPGEYIPEVADRLLLYQRLIELDTDDEVQAVREEIIDRYGNPPDEVSVLLEVMAIRALLKQASILAATLRNNQLSLTFHPERLPDAELLAATVRRSSHAARINARGGLTVSLVQPVRRPADLREVIEPLLADLNLLSADPAS